MKTQNTQFIRSFASILIMIAAYLPVFGQQDAMFTKYMFNTLVFNPAYAGSHEYLSANLLYRNQWTGIEGAPETQSLTLHSPVNDRVGLGFSLVNDRIGPTGSIQANLIYAYRFKIGPGKLAVSLQGGVMNWRADWTQLKLKDSGPDQSFDTSPSKWLPNFGAGVYYHTDHFFLGFSSPHIVNYDLRKADSANDDIPNATLYRHYYAFGGAAIPLAGKSLIFRPTFLIKNVGMFNDARNAAGRISAPTELDIDAAFLIENKLWLGASFRTALQAFNQTSSIDSGDIWAGFQFNNGLRLGLAYDITLSKLRPAAGSSFEIMLGYDMNFNMDRIVTPRYF